MENNAHLAAAALAELAGPVAAHDLAWGEVRLRLAAILDDTVRFGERLPPETVGSVRVVVTATMPDGVGVLVVHDGRDSDHASVLPGGRVEPGETTVATACREIHEETGWTLDPPSLRGLGVLHMRRLDDGDATPGFPFPDNLMLVFTGTGLPPAVEGWRDTEGQVHRSLLVRAEEALRVVASDPVETAFARAALAAHAFQNAETIARAVKESFVRHPLRDNRLQPTLIALRGGEPIAMCDLAKGWADQANALQRTAEVLSPDEVVLVVEADDAAIDVCWTTAAGEAKRVLLPYRYVGEEVSWSEPARADSATDVFTALGRGFTEAARTYETEEARATLKSLGVRVRFVADPNPFIGLEPDDLCACDSGLTYGDCHGH